MTSRDAVALVTGAAGGIGLGTARLLGQEHRLILTDRDADGLDRAAAELRAEGVDCAVVPCDVTDARAVAALLRGTSGAGHLVAVVHAAGIGGAMADARTVVAVNAGGTMHVMRAALTVAEPGLRVALLGSMAARLAPQSLMPVRAYRRRIDDPAALCAAIERRCRVASGMRRRSLAYAMSKHFVGWYAGAMAGRLAERGAAVVSIAPGAVATELAMLERDNGAEDVVRFGALKRPARVEEIAEVIAFAVRPRASYLTGSEILCDGGVVAGITRRDVLRLARRL